MCISKDECASDHMALMQVAESDGAHDVTEDDRSMYVDDRTGGKLDSKLVAAARKKEEQRFWMCVGSTLRRPILGCPQM